VTDATDRDTHIAVVGIAGRFAAAPDLDAYWRLIASGATSVRELSTNELLAAGEDPQRMADPAYVRSYGKLDGAEWFDAEFFGYAPVDAMLTDPQHRVFLECCWQAMENAGYPPSATEATVGVYAGCSQSRYWSVIGQQRDQFPGLDDVRMAMVAGADHLCLRVSYKLGLTGPSMTVLTTCSTSLVAVHQACQALLVGDCDMALAGGVSVRVPARGALARPGSVLSPDGVCRPFDAKANGTVFGDGAGVVVLKRLADAIADRDHVHAVLIGSAVNNDGRDRVGYGAPGVSGQTAVIRAAMAAGGVDPRTIDYVETHGTGTQVGDPIEITALTRAFGRSRDREPCALGAVKANIGHTDATAGIAGLLKVILAMRHGVLPPSINLDQLNPMIDFSGGPFMIQTDATPWPDRERPRRAGVSSFGIGATNAHVVVEAAPARENGGRPQTHRLLALSATTAAALDQATAELAEYLAAHPELSMDDIAYTLQVGRVAFPLRRFAVVTDHADAVRVLTGGAPQRLVTGDSGADPGPIGDGNADAGPAPDAPMDADLAGRLEWVGRRWLEGAPISWRQLPDAGQRHRVSLPTYPFQRQRHIVEPRHAMAPTAPPTLRSTTPPPTAPRPTASPPTAPAIAPSATASPTTRSATASPPTTPLPAKSSTSDTAPAAADWSAAEITETVGLLFGEVLQVPEVDDDDDFFALGGDSMIAIGLIARIEETFGTALSPEVVFASPTPAGIAEVIGELLEAEHG
jgi:acyl transferase domain-containing protein